MTAGPAEPAVSRELDAVTLQGARRGDELACRRLVRTYEATVFAFLSRMLQSADRGQVEDLAQETFVRLFRALPGFEPDGRARLSTFVLTIATRLAISHLRRRGGVAPAGLAAEPVAAASDRPEQAAGDRERTRAVAAAIEALPPDQRAVVLLRGVHDLDYPEIAEMLGIEVGTVKSRLARARATLRAAVPDLVDHE